MSEREYNGWTNYETWRINLEICDDLCESMRGEQRFLTVGELADYLSEAVDDIITGYGEHEESLAVSYARAFVSDVNWYEIANDHREDLVIESDDESEPAA